MEYKTIKLHWICQLIHIKTKFTIREYFVCCTFILIRKIPNQTVTLCWGDKHTHSLIQSAAQHYRLYEEIIALSLDSPVYVHLPHFFSLSRIFFLWPILIYIFAFLCRFFVHLLQIFCLLSFHLHRTKSNDRICYLTLFCAR